MSKAYTIREAPKTKELLVALTRCQQFWLACTPGEQAGARLFVQTTHVEALRVIAETVAPDLRGFYPSGADTNLNLTARELLDRLAEFSRPGWLGSFSGPLPFDLVTALLPRLMQLRPGPLRRTSVSLGVQELRWRGAHPASSGRFSFEDYQVFQRKVRFRIEAEHTPADALSRQAAQQELAAILAATGLDFRPRRKSGHASAAPEALATSAASAGPATTSTSASVTPPVPSPPSPTPLTPGQLANATVLFEDAVETVSRAFLAEGFDWRSLAGVYRHTAGVERRFAALALEESEQFRWETRLNAFVQETLPAFRKKADLFPDAHTFLKPLAPPWHLALIVDTHPGRRIGRIFKLRAGLVHRPGESEGPRFRVSAPVLRCAGGGYTALHDWCPEFSFNTAAEFEAILASLGPFLPRFLTRLENEISATVLTGWEDLRRVFPTPRAITVREAHALARDHLARELPGAWPLLSAQLTGTVNPLHYRTDPSVPMPADGRANVFYRWELQYLIQGNRVSVIVPWAGALRLAHFDSAFADRNPDKLPPPVGEAWRDSDEAARWFAAKRDEIAARYPDLRGNVGLTTLKSYADRPAWVVQLEFAPQPGAPRNWVTASHAVDARTGERIATTFDEVFENRTRPRAVFTEGSPPFYSLP